MPKQMKSLDELRIPPMQIFQEQWAALRGMLENAGLECGKSHPATIVAWEHFEPLYRKAESRADEREVKNWVLNTEAARVARQILSECINAWFQCQK